MGLRAANKANRRRGLNSIRCPVSGWSIRRELIT